jgi:spore coat polysaccharide biosynthesis predicted glycosyltransferase SpsG
MSQIENILHEALERGIYEQTMSFAQDIKKENPKMEVADRYELAYHKAKRSKLNAFPPLN